MGDKEEGVAGGELSFVIDLCIITAAGAGGQGARSRSRETRLAGVSAKIAADIQFQNNVGVRTVLGSVGGAKNGKLSPCTAPILHPFASPFLVYRRLQWRTVTDHPVRMLLKPGHRGVYISRPFAIKHNLVPKQVSPHLDSREAAIDP